MIQHYFEFVTSGHGVIEVDELVGFDAAGFNIKKEDGRLGRDVVFAGNAEVKLRVESAFNQCFDLLLLNYNRHGFEAVVKYMVNFGSGIEVVGQVDFGRLETDEVSYCEFLVVQENIQALFKRRYDINTNLFSSTDLDGGAIEPVQTHKMLFKSLPIVQISSWKTPNLGGSSISIAGVLGTGGVVVKYFNFVNVSESFDIDVSLNYIQGSGERHDFAYIEAENNLVNVKIEITNVNFTTVSEGSGVAAVSLRHFVGTDEEVDDILGTSVFSFSLNDDDSGVIDDGNYIINYPAIERGKKLFIYFSSTAIAQNNESTIQLVSTLNSMNIKITATAVGFNTVIPVVRYIDAIKYAVKSSCGLDVIAPRWEMGGEFYNQFITKDSLMRYLYDKPFNLSVKDIFEENIRPEVKGDYELQANNTVFTGRYEDFYRDYQIALLTLHPTLQDFTKRINVDYYVKSVNIDFKYFASQKEQTEGNTYEILHANSQYLTPNKQANETIDIEIGMVRDDYLTELTRRNAYVVSETSATQDDDKIFVIDGLLDTTQKQFTETVNLQHQATEDTLILKNDSSFSWVALDIQQGSVFVITTGENAGNYAVLETTPNTITLYGAGAESIDEELTTFTYIVDSEVEYVNRTTEGFDLIEGLLAPENRSNLLFTQKRILERYYKNVLATACLFKEGEPITNTLYNYKAECTTQFNDEAQPVVEGGNFVPDGAILSPYEYEMTFSCTLQVYWQLQQSLRSNRGYITTIDPNGLPLKGYIKSAEWTPETKKKSKPGAFLGKLTCVLEEKYQPYYYTIFGGGGGVIAIDLGIGTQPITTSSFTYDIDQLNFLHIFGENGKQLVPKVPYNRVKVNNAQNAQSTFELAQWLFNLQ